MKCYPNIICKICVDSSCYFGSHVISLSSNPGFITLKYSIFLLNLPVDLFVPNKHSTISVTYICPLWSYRAATSSTKCSYFHYGRFKPGFHIDASDGNVSKQRIGGAAGTLTTLWFPYRH